MGPQDLLDALDEIVYVSDPPLPFSAPHPGLQGQAMLCTAAGPARPLSLLHQCPAHTGQILRLGIQQPFHGAAFSFERQTD